MNLIGGSGLSDGLIFLKTINEASTKQSRGRGLFVWTRGWWWDTILSWNICLTELLLLKVIQILCDSVSTFPAIWKIFMISTFLKWTSFSLINKGKCLRWASWRVSNWIFMKHKHLLHRFQTWAKLNLAMLVHLSCTTEFSTLILAVLQNSLILTSKGSDLP